MAAKVTWIPTKNVIGHDGRPIPSNLIFFAPSPVEIGEVESAYSTLVEGRPAKKRNWFSAYTSFLYVLAFAAGAASLVAIVTLLTLPTSVAYVLSLATGGIVICVGFALIVFILIFGGNAECTYVGTKGVARFIWNEKKKKYISIVLLFQSATELRTEETREYINDSYVQTSYSYEWTNALGESIYSIIGAYRSEKGQPPSNDSYHFARAAEDAWSKFALEQAKQELVRNGTVRFNLRGGDALIVGNGFVEIHKKENHTRCYTRDIDRVSIRQGIVELRRKDARSNWFGLWSSGTFKFNYQDLGNAKLFLLLFSILVGTDSE